MKGITKGLILSNFLYLIVFYITYFLLVPVALYFQNIICGGTVLTIFATQCAQIPASTTAAMNFMLFVMIPIAALIVTIIASREPEYAVAG